MQETILICEDSPEGILTAVYQAYFWKLDREQVFLQIGEEGNLRLFAEYRKVEADPQKAAKVAATVKQKMGEAVYMDICCVLASEDKEKAQAVYRTIVTALDRKQYRQVMADIKDPYIQKAFELTRYVKREIDHLYGFLRFRELENKVLYAKIGPKNNVITLLIPHFANRHPLENFIIHDDIRQIFVLHPAQKECIVVRGEDLQDFRIPSDSKEEQCFQSLFVEFCHTIAIKERENPALQQNMLPLRFQDYMVEFARNS